MFLKPAYGAFDKGGGDSFLWLLRSPDIDADGTHGGCPVRAGICNAAFHVSDISDTDTTMIGIFIDSRHRVAAHGTEFTIVRDI